MAQRHINRDRRNRMRKAFLGLPRQELAALKARAVERGESLARVFIARLSEPSFNSKWYL